MNNGAKWNGVTMVLGSSRADKKISCDHSVESLKNDYIHTAPGRKEALLNPSSTERPGRRLNLGCGREYILFVNPQ